MSNERDYAAAVRKFAQFHRYDADVVTETDFKIPQRVELMGPSVNVKYVSAKIDPTTLKAPRNGVQGYAHDHDAGVNVYVPEGARGGEGTMVAVPPFIRKATALVQLGNCLGFEFQHGTVNYGTYPDKMGNLPGLFATDCGHALLIIDKRLKLRAIMWGGSLRVEARGIVG